MATITRQILDTLQDTFRSQFKEYYEGDPIDIPRSAIPCLIVFPENVSVTSGPTGMDRLVHKISVVVALDKTDDYGKSASAAATTQRLQAYAMGQRDDGTFEPQSVMGVLRRDLTIAGYLTNQDAEIDYGGAVRPDTITAEARITFTCTQLVQVTRAQRAN